MKKDKSPTVEVQRKWLEELVKIAEKAEGSKLVVSGEFSIAEVATLIGYAKSGRYLLMP